jgi:hypothetical protein
MVGKPHYAGRQLAGEIIVRTIIRPQGEQLERLRANTGLDHYTVDGPLISSTTQTQAGLIEVWLFDFTDIIEPEVRVHMIETIMKGHKATRKEATNYLRRVPSAVPKQHVKIEKVK